MSLATTIYNKQKEAAVKIESSLITLAAYIEDNCTTKTRVAVVVPNTAVQDFVTKFAEDNSLGIAYVGYSFGHTAIISWGQMRDVTEPDFILDGDGSILTPEEYYSKPVEGDPA